MTVNTISWGFEMNIYARWFDEWGNAIEQEPMKPMIHCKGGVTVPGPTQAEQDMQSEQANLLREQTAILKEQTAQQAALEPLLMESMGIRKNAEGGYEKIPVGEKAATPQDIAAQKQLLLMGYSTTGAKLSEEEQLAGMTASEQREYQLTKQIEERQGKALAGQLDVSPALESDLSSRRKQLEENLYRRVGPDWQQSTPGIQSMSELEKNSELLREESRRGTISAGEGMLLNRMQMMDQDTAQMGQTTGMYSDLNQRGISNLMSLPSLKSQTMQGQSGLLQGYSTAMQPFQMQRQLQTQGAMQSSANNAAGRQGLYGALGSMAGLGLGSYMAFR